MAVRVDAGSLNKPAQVLECRETDKGVWTWVPVRRAWIGVTLTEKSNLFSKVGVGARDAVLVARRQELSLHHALRQGETHFFLTSITERNRTQLDIHAAVCQVTTLTAKPQDETGRDGRNRPVAVPKPSFTFPGVLTELYCQNAADEVFRTLTRRRVLVTPKAILLRPGDLVSDGGETPYTVRQTLDLDPYKNEHVIERMEDV